MRVRAGLADDIRKAGWRVAVHNDYSLHGCSYTFWLFTKEVTGKIQQAVKGEGATDGEALNEIRKIIGLSTL